MISEDRAKRAGVTSIEGVPSPAANVNRFRRKRFYMLQSLLDRIAVGKDTIRLLDLGGTRAYWEGVRDLWQHLPLDITIINIGAEARNDPPYRLLGGDACNLAQHPNNSFDIVHSNSVIEHVGHWAEITAMAKEIQRLAPHYFVQTPNYGFPLEPHYRTLFFHWLPESVRASILTKHKLGFRGPEASFHDAMRNVQTVNLLTARQMAALFPDAKIAREKFAGLSKSLIAIR
ncbi:class I SAM-dependent methyltransferase [Sphingobium sp. SCG-1]|uniref:class I SAM-dependent methyltransferase n=1 Tax=Sphingobium sp. SCG-1 TaxID=2072936 RepID=UPI001CB91842|nr:methyltransferase domain-containing protein [Sphingobium sp. SCG-1]